jgi:hypothetical protein
VRKGLHGDPGQDGTFGEGKGATARKFNSLLVAEAERHWLLVEHPCWYLDWLLKNEGVDIWVL